jgi:hypothetical protein
MVPPGLPKALTVPIAYFFGMPIVKFYREHSMVSCMLSQWRSPPVDRFPLGNVGLPKVDLFSAKLSFFWNFRYLVEFFLISLVFPFVPFFLFAP